MPVTDPTVETANAVVPRARGQRQERGGRRRLQVADRLERVPRLAPLHLVVLGAEGRLPGDERSAVEGGLRADGRDEPAGR